MSTAADTRVAADADALLHLRGLRAGYGAVEVLREVNLRVKRGEIVTIIGVNGSGKSTLLKVISGVVKPWQGIVELGGETLTGLGVERVVSQGVVQVPEGRQLFGPLTVQENLELGGYSRRGRRGRPAGEKMREVFELFPRLQERRHQHAATLSGGEQQMLAVGRALMAEPRVLLLDEPSMGLAPLVIKEIFRTLKELNERGLTLLLVEQDARIALSLAHRGLVMERGRIVMEDSAAALLAADIQSIYFGRGGGRTDVAGDGGEGNDPSGKEIGS